MTAKPSKESIIAAYHDLVKERSGEIIGSGVFARETGLSTYHWRGGYWRDWTTFQADAGYAPNTPTQKIDDEVILRRFAELALERGALPTEPDVLLKRRGDPSFPGTSAFRRWGSREALLAKVAEFCEGKSQFAPVVERLRGQSSEGLDRRLESLKVQGFVYLLKSGKHYKLGRSNAVGRRVRELAIQLPKKPSVVHVIETDDSEGIEAYWHNRFSGKREGGEWFVLSPEDIRAFKRRRYQ